MKGITSSFIMLQVQKASVATLRGWAKTGVKAFWEGGLKVSEKLLAEVGGKTLSDAAWKEGAKTGLDALSDAERALKYVEKEGLLKALLPTGRGLFLGIGTEAWKKGPTLGAVVIGIPAIHAAIYGLEKEWDYYFGDDCP